MANAAYEAALEQVSTMKTTCQTMRNNADAFKLAVQAETTKLRECTARLTQVKTNIDSNVQRLRQRLGACQAALKAAQDGIGTLDPADVAARIGALLEGFNGELDGLDTAAADLDEAATDACDAVEAMEGETISQDPGLREYQQGGRRRVRRGGWTPQPPKCRGCCGRGTKRHKKSGKCVGKKKRRKSRRGRRRRRRR